MAYASEPIIKALKTRRTQLRLSQRELARKVASPQSHIARIESGVTDPKLATLVELARTLELELMVIPRQLVPTVKALIRQMGDPKGEGDNDTPQPAYTLSEDDDE